MILSDEQIKEIEYYVIKCNVRHVCNGKKGIYDIVSDLLDTISAKDTQIQQLQQGFMPQLEEALKDKKYYRDIEKQLQNQIQDMQERLDKVNKKVSYIINQYETDFTEFELTHDFLCPRERVVLECAREALDAIERGGK